MEGEENMDYEDAFNNLIAQTAAMEPEKRESFLKDEWGMDDKEIAEVLGYVDKVLEADSLADANIIAEGIENGNINEGIERIASDQDNELEEKAAKMANEDGTDVDVTETDRDGDGDVDETKAEKKTPEDDSKNSEAEDKPHDENLSDEEVDKAYAKANDNKTNQFARHLGELKY